VIDYRILGAARMPSTLPGRHGVGQTICHLGHLLSVAKSSNDTKVPKTAQRPLGPV
jgi:hypothetical protein